MFVIILCLVILNCLVLVDVAAVMHEIYIYFFILRFCFSVTDYYILNFNILYFPVLYDIEIETFNLTNSTRIGGFHYCA